MKIITEPFVVKNIKFFNVYDKRKFLAIGVKDSNDIRKVLILDIVVGFIYEPIYMDYNGISVDIIPKKTEFNIEINNYFLLSIKDAKHNFEYVSGKSIEVPLKDIIKVFNNKYHSELKLMPS